MYSLECLDFQIYIKYIIKKYLSIKIKIIIIVIHVSHLYYIIAYTI